jgi:hypothetical protein
MRTSKEKKMTPDQMEDQQNIDSMLILEGKLQERVNKLIGNNVERTIINIIGKQIQEAIKREKAEMMLEIAVKVGQMLKAVEKDERRPLWESTPEEFKLTHADLNSHMVSGKISKENDDAQTP